MLVAISACCQIGGCLAYYGSEFEPLIGHQHLTRGRMTSGKVHNFALDLLQHVVNFYSDFMPLLSQILAGATEAID